MLFRSICFENAKWAYTVGAAMAIKKGCTKAKDAAAEIGVGLQAFCIPGSVAENRQVGRGHGNLGAMLLDDATECFAFLAGHESFAAAEGAIKIALNANKVRKTNLRDQQLTPQVLRRIGKENIIILATKEKIMQLRGQPLLVDTGDAELDQYLSGYHLVICDYQETIACKVCPA